MKVEVGLRQTALVVSIATAFLALATPLLIEPAQRMVFSFGGLAPVLSVLILGLTGGAVYASTLFLSLRLGRKT
jgi:hypothetical protein